MQRNLRAESTASAVAFISYPKSGRTWMRYVFHLVGIPVRFTHAGHGTSLSEIGAPFSQVMTSVLGAKNIFMFRNPLDTAVSLYFQVHKKDFRRTTNTYFRKYLKLAVLGRLPPTDMNEFVVHPIWGVHNVCRFNRSWLDFMATRAGDLVINYEQARGQPRPVIKQVLDYCAISADVEHIVRASSFEVMKARELKEGRSKALMLHGLVRNDPETMKVRRGVIRGYLDYLEPDVIERARQVCREFQFEI